jgi:hypothetical protein
MTALVTLGILKNMSCSQWVTGQGVNQCPWSIPVQTLADRQTEKGTEVCRISDPFRERLAENFEGKLRRLTALLQHPGRDSASGRPVDYVLPRFWRRVALMFPLGRSSLA